MHKGPRMHLGMWWSPVFAVTELLSPVVVDSLPQHCQLRGCQGPKSTSQHGNLQGKTGAPSGTAGSPGVLGSVWRHAVCHIWGKMLQASSRWTPGCYSTSTVHRALQMSLRPRARALGEETANDRTEERRGSSGARGQRQLEDPCGAHVSGLSCSLSEVIPGLTAGTCGGCSEGEGGHWEP